MTKPSVFKAAALSLIVGLGGTAALPGPAKAGQITMSITPTDRQAAGALGTALQLYSAYHDLRSGSIRQRGRDNRAGLTQNGRANRGLVEQRGDRHSGTLQQNGDRNAYGLFQFGRGANDAIVQNGNRRSGVTFSYGW